MCQHANKKLKKASGSLHPVPIKSKIWNQVGMDQIGPLPHTPRGIYKQYADNDDDETFLNLNVPNVQQKTGVDDCGLFAIAFAVRAARGYCVGELDFDQAKMRSHVIKCFSQKKMLPFPIIESTYCTSIKRHMFFPGRQIELFCECRMPETYDNMIQCDQCCTWFHIKCMNLHAMYSK